MVNRVRRSSVSIKWVAPIAASALMLFAVACDETGDTQKDSRTIDADGATSALVKVEMGTGRLKVAGGGSSL